VVFADRRRGLEAARAGAVHWPPHAAGMWRRSGDGQDHGSKAAREQENQQQSGGQAVHDWSVFRQTSGPKDRLGAAAKQALGGYVGAAVWLAGKDIGVSGRIAGMTTIVLLTISNIFMTFAWYGHLKYRQAPLFKVILVSWGVAFFEYCFQVPANRIGSYEFTAVQLKTIQEVITLAVFSVFSVLYLDAPIRWNYILGFALIVAAVFVIFKKW